MTDVYVLGSGFSVKAGAPLSRSVLSAIFRPDRCDRQLQELKLFLDDFLFRGRQDWVPNTELEEVLSRLDLIRHYQPYPHTDYERVSYYEELLLGEFTRLLAPENTDCSQPVYGCFNTMVKPGDTVISFNYDLIMEGLLASAGRGCDYNLSLGHKGQSHGKVDLLKLHGSINLYYCPVCGEVFMFSPFMTEHPLPQKNKDKAHGRPEGQKYWSDANTALVCMDCTAKKGHARLKHFIIAPTLFKSYSLPSLRRLWFKALETLARADAVYFIGYSLPESDILSYQLFDYGKRLARRDQQVFLINGPKPPADRFMQIYGPDLVNEGVYFEDWVCAKV